MKERRSRGGAAVFSPIKRTVFVVILALLLVSILASIRILGKKQSELSIRNAQAEELRNEILLEEEKAKNLNKSSNKVTDDEEVEALARQELGLIKRDEIVIKPR